MAGTATQKIAVFVEPTPNPNSLKFIVGRDIISKGSFEFANAADAANSMLASALFAIQGVEGVFIGKDFVTVRKTVSASWDEIEPKAIQTIEDAVSSGQPLVGAAAAEASAGGSDVEAKIRRILDEEIRPAVASDGGDVMFQKYDNGVLTLRLVGSCSGCPSSTMTLKMGIERRLKEDVPDLREVISLM
ncbi:NifU family protein [Candidatus Sumerlaeota bacterium]|nr:NifU family protein [Candidatus Sumerlaeota bacterium]